MKIKLEQIDEVLAPESPQAAEQPAQTQADAEVVAEAVEPTQTIISAGRNDFLMKQAGVLIKRGWPHEAIMGAILSLNAYATDENHPNYANGPLSEREVASIVKSAERYREQHQHANNNQMTREDGIEFMNEKYAIVLDNGNTIVVYREYSPILERELLVRSTFADITKFHTEPILLRTNEQGRPVYEPLGKLWTKSPDARKYARMVFNPDPNFSDPQSYNLWRGFSVNPEPGDWSLLKDHIWTNICSENELYFNYFMGWLARMVQQPATPGEVAIVLRGGKGTGKSLLFRNIGKMMGQHFTQVSNAKHMTGNFNAHLQDTVFLFADEAFYAGDKPGESTLKALITEKTLFVEAKGVDGKNMPNFLHIAMASNYEWVIPASADERRFFVLDVSIKRQQDSTYFGAIERQMAAGGTAALLYDLLKWDLTGFDVRSIPETKALTEQKERSFDGLDAFIRGRLEEGRWFTYGEKNEKVDLPEDPWCGPINKVDLRDEFSLEMKNIGLSPRGLATLMGMRFRKIFPSSTTSTVMKGKVTVNYYIFPDLEQCRRDFEKYTKTKIDWPVVTKCDVPPF